MDQVVVREVFDGPPEVVFDFLLFLALGGLVSAELRGSGQLDSRERDEALRTGVGVATSWHYPARLVVEKRVGPACIRTDYEVTRSPRGLAEVSYAFALIPEGLLGRLVTFRERRKIRRLGPEGYSSKETLARMKWEFEERERTTLAPAFDKYRKDLAAAPAQDS